MIVVDASVLATALVDDEDDGAVARTALADDELAAPELIDLEFLSFLRRQVLADRLPPPRALQAIEDLTDLPLRRVAHAPLLDRCWQLRDNLTVYDASYVALAEILDVPLLTADAHLASAPGPTCTRHLVPPTTGPTPT